MKNNECRDFYDKLASSYGEMTQERDRWSGEETWLRQWSQDLPAGVVLDVACGTGLHGRILAELGHKVIGADISEEMLKQGELARAGEKVTWIQSDLTHLDFLASKKLSAALCLGNSIAHLDEQVLLGIMKMLRLAMSSGAKLLMQTLNYSLVLEKQQRWIMGRKQEEGFIIRFYDFLENGSLRFNILKTVMQAGQMIPEWPSTIHYPHSSDQLTDILQQAGFVDIACGAQPRGEAFDVSESKNLWISACCP